MGCHSSIGCGCPLAPLPRIDGERIKRHQCGLLLALLCCIGIFGTALAHGRVHYASSLQPLAARAGKFDEMRVMRQVDAYTDFFVTIGTPSPLTGPASRRPREGEARAWWGAMGPLGM